MKTTSLPHDLNNRVVEIIKTGILMTDREGNIHFTNKPALVLLGYRDESLVGKSVENIFLPNDIGIFLPNIMKLTLEASGYEGEALLRKKDGTGIFVYLSTALYEEKDDSRDLVVFAIQDITHLKKMEREILSSDRFLGLDMMTDHISHQIRNPVVSIGGFALRLARDQVTPNDYVRYTKIIHNEARRLEYIIDRLVELARVSQINYAPLTLMEIFKGVENILTNDPAGSPPRIRFPEPETMAGATLFGDIVLLVRAVQCLAMNGLEALAPNKGEVQVSGDIGGGLVTITVRDNGEGILPENLPFIFDPFFTTRFQCLGLGLTLVKRIVQEHRGQLEIVNAPGEGTEAVICLPRERRREIRTKLF